MKGHFSALALLLGPLLFPLASRAQSPVVVPGFTLEKFATVEGFLTSLAVAPDGRLSYSVTNGGVYHDRGDGWVRVAKFETASVGNEALLGFVWRDSNTIVGRYSAPDHTADLVGIADVRDGSVREIARFPCDDGRPCSSEHHGGNMTMAPDGTIYFALGDYGGGLPAQRDDSPGGKVWELRTDDSVHEFARGFRNSYDLAWLRSDELLVSDNGPVGEDEINIVRRGGNYGWPYTAGLQAPVQGMVPPAYTFPGTVAPTGLALMHQDPRFAGGALVASFVPRALYYFPPPLSQGLLSRPVILMIAPKPIIDVIEDGEGNVWVATPTTIYRLGFPRAGDADGDGALTDADADAIAREILDGDGYELLAAHGGSVLTGWGADANLDGIIDARDLVALSRLRATRSRPVRRD